MASTRRPQVLALLRWSTAEATGLHKPHTATEHRFFEPTPPALVMFEPMVRVLFTNVELKFGTV